MEIKTNKIDNVKHEVEFELNYSDLQPYFEKQYKKYQKTASIDGFRKGKAPLFLIKQRYGTLIEKSSLEDIANDVYKEYLENEKINPVGNAELIDIDYEDKQSFKFKVKYEILPKFELAEYKGLEVNKTIYEVDDKIIDEEIKYLQHKHNTFEDTNQAEDNEYVITADIQILDDTGVELIGQTDKDVQFYLNDPQLNKEFISQLESISVGEQRILNIPSEDNTKTEKYKITCKKIQKVILPELNEEFFKKLYPAEDIKSLDDLKNKIKGNLENLYKDISERELENNIIDEIIRLNDITVPDALANHILDSNIEEIKNRNPKRKLPDDFNEVEYRKEKKVDAVLQVKWLLIRDKIIEKENINVNDSDYEEIIEHDAKKYNLPQDKLRNIYLKNNELKNKLLENKLLKFLKENAIIKEVKKKQEADEVISEKK
jgi:trigger factor